MRKIYSIATTLCALMAVATMVSSCDDGETYADMKEKEKSAINSFIKDNDIVGPIKVITESEFYANDSVTDVEKNEFVCFSSSGIYMQIVRRGEGLSMVEMAKADPDSTVAKMVLCRFMEYDIESGDTTLTNFYISGIVDKMRVSYSQKSRSYTASFTEGYMNEEYSSSSVPTGWLKPFDFIRLTRKSDPSTAKVRLIVPHTSGTSNASGYVLPMYYEISYQLGV